ncbi:MAG: hypothetical protein IPM39_22315 [Chloroflexi bacterium]|nr:hypothetical protein [Chloroflexota bacterium]
MGLSTPSPIVLHAEQEHPRLRFAILALLLLIFALFFFLLRALFRLAPGDLPSFALVLACGLAAPLTLGIGWGIETWLKRVWPSGYNLVLNGRTIQVNQPELETLTFDLAAGGILLMGWYFALRGYKRGGRERRVPDHWLCLACQLQQDDSRLICYTYAPPTLAENLFHNPAQPVQFYKINPVEVYGNTLSNPFQAPERPKTIPTRILNSKDGRFWLAEQRRWTEGLELPLKEFEIFLHYLQTQTGGE